MADGFTGEHTHVWSAETEFHQYGGTDRGKRTLLVLKLRGPSHWYRNMSTEQVIKVEGM